MVESDDLEDIKEKTSKLQEASMKLGEIMYRQQQEDAAGATPDVEATGESGGASSDTEDEQVVDADFTEVNDDDDDGKKNEKA